jgi:hypothetical protein
MRTLRAFNFCHVFVVLAGLVCLASSSSVLAQCSLQGLTKTGNGARLAASQSKSYHKQCGLAVRLDTSPGYVTSSAPNNEKVLYARFYLNTKGVDLSSGDATIFKARGNNGTQARLALRKVNGQMRLVTTYRTNGSMQTHPTQIPLRDGWQAITVAWASGAVSGSVGVLLDGQPELFIGGLINAHERITDVDLGVLNDANGTGSLAFDSFQLRRSGSAPELIPVNELYNISTRAPVGTGTKSVVGGFVIEGTSEKCVVVRGRGPSINNNATKMADPTLTLKRAGESATLEFNDHWRQHPTAERVRALGLAPTENLESAFYTCLSPGPYTAQLKSAAGKRLGLGIVEVFDVDSGTPNLLNISTRSSVESGARRVIAGFIIEGDEPKQVLIRGRGPTVNVNATRLDNPELELRQGATVIASNGNWEDASNSGAISATGLAPDNRRESAILTTLQPGAYTVFLQSQNTRLGIGIIEVFDMSGSTVSDN